MFQPHELLHQAFADAVEPRRIDRRPPRSRRSLLARRRAARAA